MGEKKSFHQVAIHMGGMNTDSHLTPCAKFNLITGLIVEAKTINPERTGCHSLGRGADKSLEPLERCAGALDACAKPGGQSSGPSQAERRTSPAPRGPRLFQGLSGQHQRHLLFLSPHIRQDIKMVYVSFMN